MIVTEYCLASAEEQVRDVGVVVRVADMAAVVVVQRRVVTARTSAVSVP